jgi:hypothetical protein
MGQRRVLSALGVLALVETVLIALAVGPASADKHWPGPLDYVRTYHWPALAIFTVLGSIVTIRTLVASREPSPPIDLKAMADELADAVRSNWLFETARWKIQDPYPLPVGWVPASQNLLASWTEIARLAEGWPTDSWPAAETWSRGLGGLAGSDDDLAEVVNRVPTGRLVVLGKPGAGKTILLIRTVLRLIDGRDPGQPVPFLLPLASWNPGEQDLMSWMAEWMATTWAPLARPVEPDSSRSLARALLEASLITPVLDGLDEIARELRTPAITELNRSMRGHIRGLILSCRTDAYETAVRPASDVEFPLAGAAGIELAPLPAEEVAEYLKNSAGGPVGAARWSPVITAMSAIPPPPVAEVLTSPLMAALARAIYNPPPEEVLTTGRPDPAELLDQHAFPAKEDVELHLYDQFIPACYLPHPNREHASRRFRWTATQATGWLTFLARYLENPDPELRTTDFLWWRLDEVLRPHRVTLALCAVLGLVAAIGYPFPGFGVGLLAGMGTGMIARRWLPARKDGIAQGLTGGLIGGVLAALSMLPFYNLGPRHQLASWLIAAGLGIGIAVAPVGRLRPGIAAGFIGTIVTIWYEHAASAQSLRLAIGPGLHVLNGLGAAVALYLCVELLGREAPARRMHWSWLWCGCGATIGAAVGLTIGIEHGLTVGLASGLSLMVAAGFTGLVGEPIITNLDSTADPVTAMRHDRTSFLASWLTVGTALGAGTGLQYAYGTTVAGQPNGIDASIGLGITNFLVPAIGFAFIQATWGRYSTARVLLALSGHLPWRLTAFLQDAAVNRGVLRQFGAVYQFRHVELQRRLAAPVRQANSDPVVEGSVT